VSVTERVGLIARVRRNAVAVAKAWLEQRERLGYPLGGGPEYDDGEAG
jgi:glycyl-tRNA synthetase alpha subunit